MITSDVIESKEISHMWDEGMQILDNRLASIEKRLSLLEEEIIRKGMTHLEYKIDKTIRDHMNKFSNEISEILTQQSQ